MERDIGRLASEPFDVVVVGGGIVGAFTAWDAVRRGLRVALLEKDDFGSGTTAACGKVLHGGLRHLAGGSAGLALEAAREQAVLARLAGSLARPVQFVVPPGGGKVTERMRLGGARWAWRLFRTVTRAGAELPPPRLLRGEDLARTAPGVAACGFDAALAFHDLQVRSPERLTLAVVWEAAREGAAVANHAEVDGVLRRDGAAVGVSALDRLSGERFRVEAAVVVAASGPWVVESPDSPRAVRALGFARGIHAVLDGAEPRVAMALPWGDVRSVAGPRRVFVMPWEGRTLVGATFEPYPGRVDECGPEPGEVAAFVDRLGARWSALGLDSGRVVHALAGLYPRETAGGGGDGGFNVLVRPRIIEHAEPRGLVTVVSVKLTTARRVASSVVDRVFRQLGHPDPGCTTVETPGPLTRARATTVGDDVDAPLDAAFVREAVDSEMARKLADLVLRRSPVLQRSAPGRAWLADVGRRLGAELGWTPAQCRSEVESVMPSGTSGPRSPAPESP